MYCGHYPGGAGAIVYQLEGRKLVVTMDAAQCFELTKTLALGASVGAEEAASKAAADDAATKQAARQTLQAAL